jgi:hypothetical protein
VSVFSLGLRCMMGVMSSKVAIAAGPSGVVGVIGSGSDEADTKLVEDALEVTDEGAEGTF